MKEFIQSGPVLKNQFDDDELLKSFLKIKLPKNYQEEIFTNLTHFGDRVISDVLEMAQTAEANPPTLTSYDSWGKKIDQLTTSQSWKDLDRVSAEEEIVSIAYKRKYAQYSRMFQFSKLYLFHPSSAFYTCPLAMTDGAAKLLEIYGSSELKKNAFIHLTSNNPKEFWTSGQWMTEKPGGSDVSLTETIARKINGEWKLFGTKWFSSATSSQMALALARIENEKGELIAGSRGLSLFYVELKNKSGEHNNLEILRLKDKLGTNALPTAELKLNGTVAQLIGEHGSGVKLISSMFNITRLYNAVTAVGAFRRVLTLAKDYSKKRHAFTKTIIEQPLHLIMLAKAEVDFHASFHLTFLVSELLGNDEVFSTENTIKLNHDELSKILRLLTPIVKLYTAKKTVVWTSELLEGFGGVGYIEDSGIPRFYRDNQVFSIWEGTTNILSLDLLRALEKDQSYGVFKKMIQLKLSAIDSTNFEKEIQIILAALTELENFINQKTNRLDLEGCARDIAFSLGNIAAATSLLEHAAHKEAQANAQLVMRMFLEKKLCELLDFDQNKFNEYQKIIL